MEKLLFVDSCIRREKSRTKKLADYFMAKVTESGRYEVDKLCLMDEPLACLTEGYFRQRVELLRKKELEHPRFRYAHQFAKADKIVIAAPFWDLSIPALLKVYIENLCVNGITFSCTAQGLTGLCKADDMVFVTTRGTSYQNSPMEMGSRYMEAMSKFWGIGNYECLFAEGLDAKATPPEEILEESKKLADEVAQRFNR